MTTLFENTSSPKRKPSSNTPSPIPLTLQSIDPPSRSLNAGAMVSNPFPQAESNPKTLHLYFLADLPEAPDLEALDALKRDTERYTLAGKLFYLYAPEGIGRSKLAARVEKSLGVAATARNWRSVSKIMAMAKENG